MVEKQRTRTSLRGRGPHRDWRRPVIRAVGDVGNSGTSNADYDNDRAARASAAAYPNADFLPTDPRARFSKADSSRNP
jgi:hypothetical protein